MLSYTALYGLFALMSVLLFNALILLARYAHQIKSAPQDEDFDRLELEKGHLLKNLEIRDQEVVDLELQLKQSQEELALIKTTQNEAAEAAKSA